MNRNPNQITQIVDCVGRVGRVACVACAGRVACVGRVAAFVDCVAAFVGRVACAGRVACVAAFVGLLLLAACSSDGLDELRAEQGKVTITTDLQPYDVCLVAMAGSAGPAGPAYSAGAAGPACPACSAGPAGPAGSAGAAGPAAAVFPAVDGGGRGARVNVDGDRFIDGDFIRLKIICPFVSTTERGEYTEGDSYDAFYYLKRSGSSWERVVQADGFDINGTYTPSYSPDISSYYEAQQTPYVYVATTFSEERRFVANGHLYDHLTPVFHADQTKEKHYRASDVLWAQTFMQTGAWNIHLGFQHKMACLDITIDDALLPDAEYEDDGVKIKTPSQKISADAVLTLENMPDIDQAEIVVGDYYADASKYNSGYGYRQKSSCSYENNGKVLGIAVNDESEGRAKVWPMSGNPAAPGGAYSAVFNPGAGVTTVPNTATYTAYKEATKHYRLIVPPCNLDPGLPDDTESTKHAVFWLRDGTRRFKIELPQLTFEEGKLYAITLKPSNPTPAPDSGSQPDTGPIPTP